MYCIALQANLLGKCHRGELCQYAHSRGTWIWVNALSDNMFFGDQAWISAESKTCGDGMHRILFRHLFFSCVLEGDEEQNQWKRRRFEQARPFLQKFGILA